MHWYDKLDNAPEPILDLGLAENVQRCEVGRPAEVKRILERIAASMKVQGFPNKDVCAVSLALHLVVTRAFRHGNRRDHDQGVRICFLVTADEVLVRVQDESPGFDPAPAPAPYRQESLDLSFGHGLMLIRAYSTWVSFDPPGNRVTFARRRSNP